MLRQLRFPIDIQKEIAQREKLLRKRKKLTQSELSQRSGVSLPSLKRFEQTGEISLASLVKISVVLDDIEALDMLFTQREYRSIQEVIDERNS